MREGFQLGFHNLFKQLEGQTLSDLQHNQALLYISNCMAYLPFADITPYESFAIPQSVFHEGRYQWQLVDYKVVPIELTPTSGFKSVFIKEYDRVFAYGFEPINHPPAEPHLVFMGTTYPAGQGFATTVNTDLEGFETAGKTLYRSGRERIIQWLDKQSKKVHVTGTSLGGSLGLLLAIDQGEKISRVDVLNPPGLYDPWKKSRFDKWDTCTDKPRVYVQKQGNDPVSKFGVWKKEWHILEVTPPIEKQGPNPGTDHALNYAGFAETTFVEMDTEADNEEHRQRNFWVYTLLRSAVYYLGMVPYRYVGLPLLRFIKTNALHIGLFLSTAALFFVIAPILLVPAISLLLPAVVASYLLSELVHFVIDCATQKSKSNLSKLMAFLEKKPTLGRLAGVLGTVMALVFAVSFVLFPPLPVIMALTLVASAPLVYLVFHTIKADIMKWLGFNPPKIAECHDPKRPRNESMDIYTNETTATFSYKEIHDYYQAKRSVLRQDKSFLPSDTHQFFKNTQRSKYDVLKQSEDPSFASESITFSATKAKIHEMRKTLEVIQRFPFFNQEALKNALQPSQEDYLIGKSTSIH